MLTLIAMLAACSTEKAVNSGDGGGGTLGNPGAVASVKVVPKNVALVPSGTQAFQAVALTGAGDTAQSTLTWQLVGGGTITDTSTTTTHQGYANDYHLQNGSPAIDFGRVTYALPFAIDGVCRPHGAHADAGAYEL